MLVWCLLIEVCSYGTWFPHSLICAILLLRVVMKSFSLLASSCPFANRAQSMSSSFLCFLHRGKKYLSITRCKVCPCFICHCLCLVTTGWGFCCLFCCWCPEYNDREVIAVRYNALKKNEKKCCQTYWFRFSIILHITVYRLVVHSLSSS
jgi:hypothetical protein